MARPRKSLFPLMLILVLAIGCGGRDAGTSIMLHPRVAHTQTRLPDGRVVLAGGILDARSLLPPGNYDIEIFDPDTNLFHVAARMKTVRATHTATLLDDGRIALIGGCPGTVVDLFDVGTQTMQPGGQIVEVRAMHTATLLSDGRILLTGGLKEWATVEEGKVHENRRYLNSIELYDPSTGLSRLLACRLSVPRRGHTAALLAHGRVLIIGGTSARWCDVIDPAAETVTRGPLLNAPREDHCATRLADGRLLITGGSGPGGNSLDIAEIYDPAKDAFRRLSARMKRAREDHTATVLADGRVLITGGEDNQAGADGRDVVLADVELFDPAKETFTALVPLSKPRDDHRASLLTDGRVLVTGGEDNDDLGMATVEFIRAPTADRNHR